MRRHPQFEREDTSILYELPVSIVQASLGAEVEVPTIDGKVKYTVPEGTQSGTVFRLRGKGVPYLHGGGRGDQFVTVRVVTPKNLTVEQKDLLRRLGESLGDSGVSPKKKASSAENKYRLPISAARETARRIFLFPGGACPGAVSMV